MRDKLLELVDFSLAVERDGVVISPQVVDKTVWDQLAVENPTHAVISSDNEAGAREKSLEQLSNFKTHVQETDVVLDLGAGYGRLGKYLLEDMSVAGYIALDSSHEMLRLCQQWYRESEPAQKTPLLIVHSDINSIPLKKNSVDLIVVSAVFLHNHKSITKQSMEEVKKVLKPGGKLVVYSSFPRVFNLMGVQGIIYQFLLGLLGRPYKNGPVRYFSRNEIKDMTEGFATVNILPVGFEIIPKRIVIFPKWLDKIWRVYFAKPLNALLAKICPQALHPWFAVHYDLVATK